MIQSEAFPIHEYKIWTENLAKVYGKPLSKLTAVDHINLLVKSIYYK